MNFNPFRRNRKPVRKPVTTVPSYTSRSNSRSDSSGYSPFTDPLNPISPLYLGNQVGDNRDAFAALADTYSGGGGESGGGGASASYDSGSSSSDSSSSSSDSGSSCDGGGSSGSD